MEVEESIRAAVLAEGARFFKALAETWLPKRLGLERPEGAKGKRTRKILTAFGEVGVRRAYVPGQGCPLDAAMGLEGRYTPKAAEMACHAAAMHGAYDKARRRSGSSPASPSPGGRSSGWSTACRRKWRRREPTASPPNPRPDSGATRSWT